MTAPTWPMSETTQPRPVQTRPGPEGPAAQPSPGRVIERDTTVSDRGLPAAPYPLFGQYDESRRAFFRGRSADVRAVADLLHQPGLRVLLLHGETGVGKSSLLRAGLIPFLRERAADHFAFAVEFRDAATQLRPELQVRDIGKAHRHTARTGPQRNLPEIIQASQITGRPHDVLGFRKLQHGAAGFLIRAADCLDHVAMGDAVGAQAIGPEHDLILADRATECRHLGNVRYRLQLVLQEPILQCAQL